MPVRLEDEDSTGADTDQAERHSGEAGKLGTNAGGTAGRGRGNSGRSAGCSSTHSGRRRGYDTTGRRLPISLCQQQCPGRLTVVAAREVAEADPPPTVRPPEAEVKVASVMEATTSEADAPPDPVAEPEAAVSEAAEMDWPADEQTVWSWPRAWLTWSTSSWVTPGVWSRMHWKQEVWE